jgi:hypothetical protein
MAAKSEPKQASKEAVRQKQERQPEAAEKYPLEGAGLIRAYARLSGPPPTGPSTGELAVLQSKAGNQAFTRLLARKPVPQQTTYRRALQRQEDEEEIQTQSIRRQEEEDEVQAKTIQRQEDEEEIQTQHLQRQEDDEEIQAKSLQRAGIEEDEVQTISLQRQGEEEEVQVKPIQRLGHGSFQAGTDVEKRLTSSKNGGSPMAPDVRAGMEQRFGADFSAVKIHAGPKDAELSRDIGAQAFTHGANIYMGQGKYDPGTTAGKRLLAHELTHVIQQTGALARSIRTLRASSHLQRKKALTTHTHTVFQADGDIVKSGKLFGKASTGSKVPAFSIVDLSDTPATNDADYWKLNNTNNAGKFIEEPLEVTSISFTRVAKDPGSLVNGDVEVKVLPGDLLDVTGSAGGYYIAKSRRDASSAEGAIAQNKVITPTAELLKSPPSPTSEAAVNRGNVPIFKPVDSDRGKSVGASGVQDKFTQAGETLLADFGAKGVNQQGKASLLFVQSKTNPSLSGYMEQSLVRDVRGDEAKLKEEYGSATGSSTQKDLDQVSLTVVVKQKTALRQIRSDSAGKVSLDATHSVNPGVILKPTSTSRFVLIDSRPWITDLAYKDTVLGTVDNEKSERLEADVEKSLKVDEDLSKISLTKARVKDNAHLRKITVPRKYSIETGPQFGSMLKADDILNVNFEIRGVDEDYSFGWVYAKTDKGEEGYIREEKLTHDESEGQVKAVTKGGVPQNKSGKKGAPAKPIQGNALPGTNKYIATQNFKATKDIKLGDIFIPEPDAVATDKFYWELKNQNSGQVEKVPKDKVILANDSQLKNPATPTRKALVTQKTGLHEPVLDHRDKNVGVKTGVLHKVLVPNKPGDRLMVDFESGGISSGKNTGWHYASESGKIGYVHSEKIRESSAELLAEEEALANPTAPKGVPDLLVPAYVIRKTRLRDENREAKDPVKAGQMIMVNFHTHPPATKPGPQPPAPKTGTGNAPPQPAPLPAPVPTKFHPDADHWVQAQLPGQTVPRYIWEHKVTARSVALEGEEPGGESTSTGGIVFEATNTLLKGLSDVGVEYMMPDPDNPTITSLPMARGQEQWGFATTGGLGAIVGLVGMVGTIRNLVKDHGSFKAWFSGIVDFASNLASGVGYAGALVNSGIKLHEGPQPTPTVTPPPPSQVAWDAKSASDRAADISNWSFSIAYGIAAVKDLFLAIYDLFTSNKSKKDKVLELLPKVLSSGQNGVKAAQGITTFFGNSAAAALTTAAPAIGIAVNLANLVLGIRKWWVASNNRNLALKAQKTAPEKEIDGDVSTSEKVFRVKWVDNELVQAVISKVQGINSSPPPDFFNEPHVKEGDKSQHQLFWKEKRGVRSLSTAYRKKLYYRVNPKLLIALRNKDRLDRRRADGTLVKRSKDFLSTDYYLEEDANGSAKYVVVKFVDKSVKLDSSAESTIHEYELASKVEEVSRKKATLGIEQIETGFVNMVGEALTLGGVTATAGAITKGVMTAVNLGFDMARYINKQVDSSHGKKYATSLKYKGEISGVDKSQNQKQREYYDHAFFIMGQIGALATPKEILDAAKDASKLASYREKYKRVQQYIEMTGVYTTLFYEKNGKPKEQLKLLVESMSER